MKETQAQTEDSLTLIEGKLQSTFHPITPSLEFKGKLRNNLVGSTLPMLETGTSAVGMLLIAMGLLSGVVILILGRRAILPILLGIGMMVSRRKKK